MGPQPPRRGAAEERPRDDDRKRGPENRGGKNDKEVREQQR
jgi:hypothetical protein